AIFYTIGQRHGLDIGGGLPYYVAGKDMDKNEVYVTTNLNDESLWRPVVKLTSVHWIGRAPEAGSYRARVRHRGVLSEVEFEETLQGYELKFAHPERAVASGQSVVLYDGEVCVGGGIVA
ncbi:tRNA 2-thiouridine(34) synthase MnmA, partial [Candidatus Saccharibacteria bacterium]|nr:tRNA 2-thiouridine(34) synthase MnmA [Candidatus Saccharibacteria bacterium]